MSNGFWKRARISSLSFSLHLYICLSSLVSHLKIGKSLNFPKFTEIIFYEINFYGEILAITDLRVFIVVLSRCVAVLPICYLLDF